MEGGGVKRVRREQGRMMKEGGKGGGGRVDRRREGREGE